MNRKNKDSKPESDSRKGFIPIENDKVSASSEWSWSHVGFRPNNRWESAPNFQEYPIVKSRKH